MRARACVLQLLEMKAKGLDLHLHYNKQAIRTTGSIFGIGRAEGQLLEQGSVPGLAAGTGSTSNLSFQASGEVGEDEGQGEEGEGAGGGAGGSSVGAGRQ